MLDIDKLSLSAVEEKLSHWRSKAKRGKGIPSEIKQDVVNLLRDHKASYLQMKLGLSGRTLKSWQREYSEQLFIELPAIKERDKKSDFHNLKFSRSNDGLWSVEGNLVLKDWQSVIHLLEGVR